MVMVSLRSFKARIRSSIHLHNLYCRHVAPTLPPEAHVQPGTPLVRPPRVTLYPADKGDKVLQEGLDTKLTAVPLVGSQLINPGTLGTQLPR